MRSARRRAAAAGLILGTAFRLLTGARPPLRGLLLGAAVFVAVGVLQAPLLWVLAVAVPLAIALEWRASRWARRRTFCWEIAWRFASLSLLAIGGINALLPEIHRVAVDVEGWMTSAEFADLFALAQLAPGPNAMVDFARSAGRSRGRRRRLRRDDRGVRPVVAALLFCDAWPGEDAQRETRGLLQRALAPVAIGLILASGYTLARGRSIARRARCC